MRVDSGVSRDAHLELMGQVKAIREDLLVTSRRLDRAAREIEAVMCMVTLAVAVACLALVVVVTR